MTPLTDDTTYEVWWWSEVSRRYYFMDSFSGFEAALESCVNKSSRSGKYQIRKITKFDITVAPQED